jgi:hypothetical protein
MREGQDEEGITYPFGRFFVLQGPSIKVSLDTSPAIPAFFQPMRLTLAANGPNLVKGAEGTVPCIG